MAKERPFLVSVDLGEVAGPALDKLSQYQKTDRSATIRDCVLVCYNFGLLKRFEKTMKQAAKDGSPNLTKPPLRPATEDEKAVVEAWREVFNYTGNIFWPKELATIRSAVGKGVTYEDQVDIMQLASNDAFINQVISRGDIPVPSMILSDGMLAKFVPMLEQVRKEAVVSSEIRLDGVVKPRALKSLKEFLSDDAMSKVYDLVMIAGTEAQVNNIVKEAVAEQLEDYSEQLANNHDVFNGVVGEWREKKENGEK